MDYKEEISKIIIEKNITQLIHFTRKQNINSILQHGLLSRERLKEKNINYQYNDPERRDNWDNSISLSITNKNHYLFNEFKRRQNLSDNDFIEIKIKPSILEENEAIFCDTNAASTTFEDYRNNPEKLSNLKSWMAFEGMFKKNIYRAKDNKKFKIVRLNQKIYEPTCVQAEICFIGDIDPNHFININELKVVSNGK